MTFGEVFKAARKNAGKTLREVSEYTGLSIGNISDIEHSRRRPPKREILQQLEDFYGVRRNQLVRAAEKEWRIPDEAISIFSKRPQLTMALLRASEDTPESELKKIIEEFGKRKTR